MQIKRSAAWIPRHVLHDATAQAYYVHVQEDPLSALRALVACDEKETQTFIQELTDAAIKTINEGVTWEEAEHIDIGLQVDGFVSIGKWDPEFENESSIYIIECYALSEDGQERFPLDDGCAYSNAREAREAAQNAFSAHASGFCHSRSW